MTLIRQLLFNTIIIVVCVSISENLSIVLMVLGSCILNIYSKTCFDIKLFV